MVAVSCMNALHHKAENSSSYCDATPKFPPKMRTSESQTIELLYPTIQSEENWQLLRLVDQHHLLTLLYCNCRMTVYLEQSADMVSRKQIQQFIAKMRLETLFSGPRTINMALTMRVCAHTCSTTGN